jgi:aryl-phospho-beta-D-glucosidase BglC (GH1 family)
MPLGCYQTEQDIAEIAGAGLNWIRLPIPFWAIETWPGEPFLAKTSWKYVLQSLYVNDFDVIIGISFGYLTGVASMA